MAWVSMVMVLGHVGPPLCAKRGWSAVENHQGADPSVRKSRLAMSMRVLWAALWRLKACAL
eukprot:12786109-Prorocentrum_lima.AAC.1